VFQSGELVEFTSQGAIGLLAHRAAMRAMRAGAAEMRSGDQWIAGFADGELDLHEGFSDAKQNGPGQ